MSQLICYACFSPASQPVRCSECRAVWFCSSACLTSDRSHRDLCCLFTDPTPSLPANSSLIITALFAKALRLQQQLCYAGALNMYRLILRLPSGLVSPALEFECYLFGAMCISGECSVPSWTKSCIRKLHDAKSMVEHARRIGETFPSSSAVSELLTEDHILDLSRVEIDIDRKLLYVLENEPFEVVEREFPSFMNPSKRFYLSNRR